MATSREMHSAALDDLREPRPAPTDAGTGEFQIARGNARLGGLTMIDLHRTSRAAACGLALVLGFATVARAQLLPPGQQAPPSKVQPLQPAVPGTPLFAQRIAGLDINVFTLDGHKYSGVFTISGNSLVSEDRWTVIAFDQVRRVEKNSYRMRLHSLIGLGVGGGLGIAIMKGCGKQSDCGFRSFIATFYAGIGAAIGAAVGGSLNVIREPRDLIFERSGGARTTIALAPMLSSIRKGIAFTISWR